MSLYCYLSMQHKLPRKNKLPQRLQRHIVVHDDNECKCVCVYIYIYILYIYIINASRLTQVPKVPTPPSYPPPGFKDWLEYMYII